MNELFPAEWFPISITVIFFLGGSRVTPTDWATVISPAVQELSHPVASDSLKVGGSKTPRPRSIQAVTSYNKKFTKQCDRCVPLP